MIDSVSPPRPFFSVVMPVYNGEAYVGNAIESVLTQSEPDWELVIVDDLSDDRTPEILEMCAQKDDRIRIFHNEKRLNIAPSLNRGIAFARGRWIVRLDADDAFNSDYLSILRRSLGADPPWETFFSCWPTIIDENGKTVLDVRLPEAKTVHRMMKTENFLYHTATSYSKRLWESVGGYPEDRTMSEDVGMWIRFFEAGAKLVMIPELLVKYRIHSSNITSLNDAKLFLPVNAVDSKAIRQNREWKISLYLKQQKLETARSEILTLVRTQKRLSLKNIQYYLLTFLPKSFVCFFMWEFRPRVRAFIKNFHGRSLRV